MDPPPGLLLAPAAAQLFLDLQYSRHSASRTQPYSEGGPLLGNTVPFYVQFGGNSHKGKLDTRLLDKPACLPGNYHLPHDCHGH